ncbi:hypothetical protein [Ornithinibacillus caprae]|nr:hypothetical protein [Ornithinibacillus caprae]
MSAQLLIGVMSAQMPIRKQETVTHRSYECPNANRKTRNGNSSEL